MNQSILALALALGVIPMSALAQDSSAPAAASDQRRQVFQQFAQQEEQLRQQMRSQILSSLTPVHRRAVGAAIGDLAIASNPDPQTAGKRLDAMLSPGERQRIIAAHSSFAAQSRQLHDSMRQQLQSTMPAGAPDHGPPGGMMPEHPQLDAGTLLLIALSPHPMMEMHPW